MNKQKFFTSTFTNVFLRDEGVDFKPVVAPNGIVMTSEDGKREYLYNSQADIINSGRWLVKE